ncbi:MAG TPA: three-Cys-motif partner protein TcmP [Chthoniobacterales bacterium]|jgi:three-Cys-motif partner protein|nr:three-Cys-motif partner protein TcmP [Chthoniobacterales bacterium]
MVDPKLYEGREQTYVKHVILDQYLAKFAHIIGSWADSITYVDGFSGPWNSVSEKFEDSSFGIAIERLKKARSDLEQSNKRTFKIRCFFVEESESAFNRLKTFTEGITDVEIKAVKSTFEAAIPTIVEFVRQSPGINFLFLLLDPKGWTGFSMEKIRVLLEWEPSEILVNFMTSHIKRFLALEDDVTKEQFERLFGDRDFRAVIAGLQGFDREYAAVEAYASSLGKTGNFPNVCKALVLKSNRDETHYHLIYATRHPRGVEVFKSAERAAMVAMEGVRATAHQRTRQKRTGQLDLLPASDLHSTSHFDFLRETFLRRVGKAIRDRIILDEKVSYDELWRLAMRFPVVWSSDLNGYLQECNKAGAVAIENMPHGARVPKFGKSISVTLRDARSFS